MSSSFQSVGRIIRGNKYLIQALKLTIINTRRNLKIHDPNPKCDFPGCSQKPFAENRDLERHRASHGIVGPLLYFCSAESCDMSQISGYKGSVRADNIKRHISRRHAG